MGAVSSSPARLLARGGVDDMGQSWSLVLRVPPESVRLSPPRLRALALARACGGMLLMCVRVVGRVA